MRLLAAVSMIVLSLCRPLYSQQIEAPVPQPGSISGVVTDADAAAIPGAKISIEGPSAAEHRTASSDGTGAFQILHVPAMVPCRVTVSAPGFGVWTSPELTLSAGQDVTLSDVKLNVANVDTAVSAVFADELAILQVKNEEQQRIFGFLPNFYTVYDPTFVPLPAKLKYKLAFKAVSDPVNFAGVMFLGGLDQASDTPDFRQGTKGYGQRVGALYADGATDIMIGGALLPSLLHQDPRYFYQGYGTKKARAVHALKSPFLTKGDNGRQQINYSSMGGDLASGALSNLYYPTSNRGAGLLFGNAAVTTGGRMVNAVLQEFVLSRFTSKVKQ